MKNVISLLVALAMVFVSCSYAFAIEDITDEYFFEDSILTRIENDFPSSTVRVVDGVFHIVLPDDCIYMSYVDCNVNTINSMDNRGIPTTHMVAPLGGTYKSFTVPWNATFIPLFQSFLTKDNTDALLIQKGNPSLYQFILGLIADNIASEAISLIVEDVFGIRVPVSVISTISAFIAYGVSSADYWSLINAKNNSTTGKVSVVYGMSYDGYTIYIYAPWNNTVCDSYQGYPAIWYAEDINDLLTN